MVDNDRETQIAIGTTDEYRYIGVTPPLDRFEISALQEAKILLGDFTVRQFGEPEYIESLITVSDRSDILRSRDGRTKRAIFVASKMAEVLRYSRSGDVDLNLEPVVLTGYNSTPFNPDTDATNPL